ncbi:MAG TPA: IgGFc-binding protein, partial [Myxococcota bacterium]|nr:IgGFc-binding protein [Myxococcota bacterium]
VAVRTARLGSSPQPERFRILAGTDGTQVTLTGGAQDAFTLDAGQVRTVTPGADVVLHATHPVLVAQYLPTWSYGEENGWNAMTLLAPVARFRKDHVFPITSFYNQDRALITAPPGTEVRLDGTPLEPSLFQEIPGTGWRFAIVAVDDGLHRIAASDPVGLQVYGHATYYVTGSNRS